MQVKKTKAMEKVCKTFIRQFDPAPRLHNFNKTDSYQDSPESLDNGAVVENPPKIPVIRVHGRVQSEICTRVLALIEERRYV